MGKSYKSELSQLPATYDYALALDITALKMEIHKLAPFPLIAIGSGGSQSTAALVADLHQSEFGQASKGETPLIASDYLGKLKSSAVFLVSASGNNPDILGIGRVAVESEPRSLIALCATKKSALSRVVNGFSRGFCFDFDLPTGKDGFLATNSLLALGIVVLRAYRYKTNELPQSLPEALQTIHTHSSWNSTGVEHSFFEQPHLVALHGAQSRSAAFDLESKLIEAGLVSVQLSDYRNFSHGRHHWLAKNPNSAVVALASEQEVELAERTIALLPQSIPTLLVKTTLRGVASWVALQTAVFDIVRKYGESKNIDPGRPGVPEFGRRIYHLNAFKALNRNIKCTAIKRKMKAGSQNDPDYRQKLDRAYTSASKGLANARFHGLILDYDGTICDHVDRFSAIRQSTVEALTRLTKAGFLLGVATGRGKSVRKALQDAIAKPDWTRVWVGYYNGGVVARLDDASQPNTDRSVPAELRGAAGALKKIDSHELELSIRPDQITIEARIPLDVRELWSRVVQTVEEAGITGVKVVTSSRSVDVIPIASTKLSLLRALDNARPNALFLCIGDRPCWPGNDAQLLSQDFSLSVDEVDGNPASVWNLAPAGILGSAALRYYLGQVRIGASYFKIRLGSP
ncbi:MAG: HAD hydrolase family protein [Candidatus Binatia bacterium]